MKKRYLNRKSLLLLSLVIVFTDQLSKIWAIHFLNKDISTPFIPFLLQLRLIKNTGAAFNLLSGNIFFLGFLSFLVSLALLILVLRSPPIPKWKGLAIAFLLGGTIGNGIDRWRLGYVNDFLELIPINFPIFNVADIAINIAVICFLIDNITQSYAPKNS